MPERRPISAISALLSILRHILPIRLLIYEAVGNHIVPTSTIALTVIAYTYDPLSRLTDATYSTGESFAYAYDAVGNRTAQTVTITSTQVTNYVYDAANRLSAVSGQPYTWDNNGNLINDGTSAYAYDQANRMISTTLGSTTSLFNYNGDGARLKQIVNSTVTTYTQDLAAPLPVVLQSKTGTNATQYVYALGTRPLAQNSTGWEYLLADALGSVRQIVNANGKVTLAESYAPYGSVLTSTGTASSIFAYAGEEVDTTGLIYLRARYMQPRLGVFTSRDPVSGDERRSQSLHSFIYVENNPVNFIDPLGMCTSCRQGSVVTVRNNGDTVNARAQPSTDSQILTEISDGTQIVIAEDSPVSGSGYAWHSTYLSRVTSPIVINYGRVWIANQFLIDAGSSDTLQFTANPVAGPYDYMEGFGATQFAYDSCHDRPDTCPYKLTRGLHNGIDFGVPLNTPIYWTANTDGVVAHVDNEYSDATPNVVIDVGSYWVIFGHMSSRTVNDGDPVPIGALLGYSGESYDASGKGDPHLHLGIRSFAPDAFYNPAQFFGASVRDSWPLAPYTTGEDMLSIKSFAMDSIVNNWDRFYWECGNIAGDVTGIER